MTDQDSSFGNLAAEGGEPEMERRLLWAARMECLAALASGLTHSLSNLLASTLMSVEVVLRANPESAQRQLLTSLQNMTREGLEMVRQVLWIARGVEGEPVVFQAQYLLVELQRLFAAFMPAVPIITSYPQDLWPLAGDPHRFVQLVLALCEEVRRELPAGAALTLSAANVEPAPGAGDERPLGGVRQIVVQVTPRDCQPAPETGGHAAGERPGDTGAAGSAGVAGAARAAGVAGVAGVAGARAALPSRPAGLWIAERPSSPAAALALAAGGFYEALSPAEGGGARIFLPATDHRSSAAVPAGEPAPGAGSRVQIFEDEPLLAQALREVLAGHGYRAVVGPPRPRPGAAPRQPATRGAPAGAPGTVPGSGRAGRGDAQVTIAGERADILLAGASLDAEGRWQLAAAALTATAPVVLMVDAETADRLDREAPATQRGFEPHAVLRKPFTARELLLALAGGAAGRPQG
jgi:hypothetical protein